MECCPPLHLGVVAVEKEPSGHPWLKSPTLLFGCLNIKTVLFQATQFSLSSRFSFIWPIDKTLLGTSTPSQSGPESEGSEGILHIPQSSRITETSPSGF